ncbi:hypothetical protein D9615_005683 [Tricholomella constricta]|uniref:Myb-like domain-containing protein n=1 Tax=Tricholomella constricta TaxID=117010 RepID=A0A8H5HAT0_9AGAR|nr:hypothetical protein D9615_005683 [Tricholomella constricta]
MDNPQHYQPLSHALHPPQAQAQPTYTSTGMFNAKALPAQSTHREEEEEEEEDGDDEGLVEEQLSRHEPDVQGSTSSSPQPKPTGTTDTHSGQTRQQPRLQDDSNALERKRRPGRPRGSKNRKPRVGQATSKPEPAFYHPSVGVTRPDHPSVNANNQQYYEFQWRVLNLCAEFYGAAEELVKGTQPLVIAQCYQMGPGNKVDPLVMLSEAKRLCDTLLANPSQLVTSPPPPIYTPTLYQPLQTPPIASTSMTPHPTASMSKSATPSAVISNPGTFVMPLPPAQTAYPHSQYSMYAPPGQYPTTPYYPYSYVTPGSYYSQPQLQPQAQAQPVQAQSVVAQPQPVQTQPEASSSSGVTAASVTGSVITSGTAAGGNQGAWSDEETERLKKLAEDSRGRGSTGEMEWDWVVHQWGNGRTRHQILIKATSLGLKESSSRGVKRRRENEGTSDATSPSIPPTPTLAAAPAFSTNPAGTSNPPCASPSHSHTASTTPAASPALQNQQRPPPKSTTLPWPMPTVAVNTPSPVLATSAPTSAPGNQEQQRTSYYRARPNQDAAVAKPTSQTQQAATHPYMYQPNGGTSRLGKENGK